MNLSREDKIRTGFTKDIKLLEVGPSYDPLIPNRGDWNVLTVDHASREELVKKCSGHANVDVSRIGDVDYVWKGCQPNRRNQCFRAGPTIQPYAYL